MREKFNFKVDNVKSLKNKNNLLSLNQERNSNIKQEGNLQLLKH